MPNIDRIEGYAEELTAIRRDLHAHPEIGFEEVRTSGIVADKLTQWGIEVHRGLGGTGVVGVLKGKGSGGKRIGLRADMDALPMEENTNLKWRSTIPGRFHGCGHDGHTTMLLGTARYLAETRNFDGTVHFIFQPAEEGLGGARAMIKDGLFEKFPCDEVYGLHNAPDLNHGEIAILPGPAMAGADFFDITINGYGAHGAMPERSKDAVVIAMTLGQALQTIVSRNVGADPPADARDLRRHRQRLPGRDHCRHPRHFQRAGKPGRAIPGRCGSGAHGGRPCERPLKVAAEDGQRGFRRHDAGDTRRLFLGGPRRIGAGAQSRLRARRQDSPHWSQHVRAHH